jgi:uncharacterized protein
MAHEPQPMGNGSQQGERMRTLPGGFLVAEGADLTLPVVDASFRVQAVRAVANAAWPNAQMNEPAYLQAHANGVYLAIKLQPRASKNGISEPLGSELKIKVTAPPVDEAANEALLRLLSDALDCPRGALQLVRGQTSRHKVVFIQRMSLATVAAKLSVS